MSDYFHNKNRFQANYLPGTNQFTVPNSRNTAMHSGKEVFSSAATFTPGPGLESFRDQSFDSKGFAFASNESSFQSNPNLLPFHRANVQRDSLPNSDMISALGRLSSGGGSILGPSTVPVSSGFRSEFGFNASTKRQDFTGALHEPPPLSEQPRKSILKPPVLSGNVPQTRRDDYTTGRKVFSHRGIFDEALPHKETFVDSTSGTPLFSYGIGEETANMLKSRMQLGGQLEAGLDQEKIANIQAQFNQSGVDVVRENAHSTTRFDSYTSQPFQPGCLPGKDRAPRIEDFGAHSQSFFPTDVIRKDPAGSGSIRPTSDYSTTSTTIKQSIVGNEHFSSTSFSVDPSTAASSAGLSGFPPKRRKFSAEQVFSTSDSIASGSATSDALKRGESYLEKDNSTLSNNSGSDKTALQNEKMEIKKKVETFEKELATLKKQEMELLRRRRKQNKGDRDPLLEVNARLQSQITTHISNLKARQEEVVRGLLLSATSTVSNEKIKKPIALIPSANVQDISRRDRTELSEVIHKIQPEIHVIHKTVVPETSKNAAKSNASYSKPDRKDVVVSKNVYQYYDAGDHWCKHCRCLFASLADYLVHLHSDDHRKNINTVERPWAKDKALNLPVFPHLQNAETRPVKGVEFLLTCRAFFCSICSEMLGDEQCAEVHMKSQEHHDMYKAHLDQHPYYERSLQLARQAGMQLKKQEERLKREKEAQKKKEDERQRESAIRKLDDEKKRMKQEMLSKLKSSSGSSSYSSRRSTTSRRSHSRDRLRSSPQRKSYSRPTYGQQRSHGRGRNRNIFGKNPNSRPTTSVTATKVGDVPRPEPNSISTASSLTNAGRAGILMKLQEDKSETTPDKTETSPQVPHKNMEGNNSVQNAIKLTKERIAQAWEEATSKGQVRPIKVVSKTTPNKPLVSPPVGHLFACSSASPISTASGTSGSTTVAGIAEQKSSPVQTTAALRKTPVEITNNEIATVLSSSTHAMMVCPPAGVGLPTQWADRTTVSSASGNEIKSGVVEVAAPSLDKDDTDEESLSMHLSDGGDIDSDLEVLDELAD